jgi:hypothetical protein
MSIIETPFAHQVKGTWYFSSHALPQALTLKAYKTQVRNAYGNLRGVIFATQGVDYQHFRNDHGRISLVPTEEVAVAPTEGNFEIYGRHERCRILARHAAGTIDVERLSDGHCFRVSGLSS